MGAWRNLEVEEVVRINEITNAETASGHVGKREANYFFPLFNDNLDGNDDCVFLHVLISEEHVLHGFKIPRGRTLHWGPRASRSLGPDLNTIASLKKQLPAEAFEIGA
jgi:hypothetical protein